MKFCTSFIFFIVYIAYAFSSTPSGQTVCLNMIVKNEAHVICRCLESIKPYIDYWVIVDTGSEDGTQGIIKECMKEIPGNLYESNWVNFEHNRNEALQFAKGKSDYVLFIDADEMLTQDVNFTMPILDKDFYYIQADYNGMRYGRVGLIKANLPWKWEGVVHETVVCDLAKSSQVLDGITNIIKHEGARSKDPTTYHKDAALLEKALLENPANTRYTFYLAQSYLCANESEKALDAYKKRVELGGWDQEVFISLLQIAKIHSLLDKPSEEVTNSFYKAYMYRPARAESLYWLANYFRSKEDYFSAYLVAKQGLTIPLSDDLLFVDHWVYEYGLLLEYSISTYWIGRYSDAKLASCLLLSKNIPQNIRDCVNKNLQFINEKISLTAGGSTTLLGPHITKTGSP